MSPDLWETFAKMTKKVNVKAVNGGMWKYIYIYIYIYASVYFHQAINIYISAYFSPSVGYSRVLCSHPGLIWNIMIDIGVKMSASLQSLSHRQHRYNKSISLLLMRICEICVMVWVIEMLFPTVESILCQTPHDEITNYWSSPKQFELQTKKLIKLGLCTSFQINDNSIHSVTVHYMLAMTSHQVVVVYY